MSDDIKARLRDRALEGVSEKRCSDYDEDCAGVSCHISCWLGGRQTIGGVTYDTPPADGYCPYLRNP